MTWTSCSCFMADFLFLNLASRSMVVRGFLVRYFLTASSVRPSFSAAEMTEDGGA